MSARPNPRAGIFAASPERIRHAPLLAPRERLAGPSVEGAMAIDKESDGMPQVDFERRTTKVNLWMIVAVALFFVAMAILVFRYAGSN